MGCGLNACAPTPLICSSPLPQVVVTGGEAFGRGLGPEEGTLWDGISVFMEGPRMFPLSFQTVRTQQEVGCHKPGRGLSPDIRSARALILNFPAFREKQISVVYKLSQFMVFLL